MLRKFLVKRFALYYRVKLFGKFGNIPRFTTIFFPLIALLMAILMLSGFPDVTYFWDKF